MIQESPSISITPPYRKGNVTFFVLLHIAAVVLPILYIQNAGFQWTDLVPTVVMFVLTCMAITTGYHRLFSHRAYQASPLVKGMCLMFGSAALESSCLTWATDHRDHHKYVDTARDPYNIHKGFFWAHIGWMLHEDLPGGRAFKNVDDLKKEPLVMFEHKYYLWVALTVGILVPVGIGALFGRPFGGFVWGAVVRQILTYHNTFFINSAAHYFGSRPYTLENTARQCWFFIPTSFGEAYHNYHHLFASDYRNGEKWYHFDMTKWLIFGLSRVGLTWGLQRAPESAIRDAIIQRKYDEAQLLLKASGQAAVQWEHVRQQIESAKQKLLDLSKAWAERKKELQTWRKTLNRQELSTRMQQLRDCRDEWVRTWSEYRQSIKMLRKMTAQAV